MRSLLWISCFILGCASTKETPSFSFNQKEILYSSRDGANIHLGEDGYLFFDMEKGNFFHESKIKPQQLKTHTQTALTWSKNIKKQRKNFKKEVASFKSGISLTYYKKDKKPFFSFCWSDHQFKNEEHEKKYCGNLDKEDMESLIKSLSEENISFAKEKIFQRSF